MFRAEVGPRVDDIPDAELREIHQVLKARLLTFVRRRLAERRQRLGLPQLEREPLEAEVLTLGFARRFEGRRGYSRPAGVAGIFRAPDAREAGGSANRSQRKLWRGSHPAGACRLTGPVRLPGSLYRRPSSRG